jgi:hypothetical protein
VQMVFVPEIPKFAFVGLTAKVVAVPAGTL